MCLNYEITQKQVQEDGKNDNTMHAFSISFENEQIVEKRIFKYKTILDKKYLSTCMQCPAILFLNRSQMTVLTSAFQKMESGTEFAMH